MLLRPEFIERLAETLEGIAVSSAHTGPSAREASVLIYHRSNGGSGGAPRAGEIPLLEITLMESDQDGPSSGNDRSSGETCAVVTSALGIVELHGIEEVRLLDATEEAAFYSRPKPGILSFLTVSSRGAIQVYMNISESLEQVELSEASDEELRAAVALKIFAEHTQVFRNE
ncbi:MAG TPA: hypothetical protein VGM92_05050 [Candidatus Kapabacteria bacterium]|jgi:hypothetical protein